MPLEALWLALGNPIPIVLPTGNGLRRGEPWGFSLVAAATVAPTQLVQSVVEKKQKTKAGGRWRRSDKNVRNFLRDSKHAKRGYCGSRIESRP